MCELSQSVMQMFRIRSQIDFKRAMWGMWDSQCDAVNGFLDWHLGGPLPIIRSSVGDFGPNIFCQPSLFAQGYYWEVRRKLGASLLTFLGRCVFSIL